MQVHAVFASLTKSLPSIKLALLNGNASAREEAALLHCGHVPDATPSLLGLFPAIQPLYRDEANAVDYHPTVSSCLMQGAPGFCFGDEHAGSRDKAPQWQGACAVHIAVVTPGRLVHHLQRLGSGWLRQLNFLVRRTQSHLHTTAKPERAEVLPCVDTLACCGRQRRPANRIQCQMKASIHRLEEACMRCR